MSVGLPDPASRPAVAAMAACWLGVVAGRLRWGVAVPTCLLALVLLSGARRAQARGAGGTLGWVGAALLAGLTAGVLSSVREQGVQAAVVPTGSTQVLVTALSDARPSRFGGTWFLARPFARVQAGDWLTWAGPPILVASDAAVVDAGGRYEVAGRLSPASGMAAGSVYAGRLRAETVVSIRGGRSNPVMVVGNALRHRVIEQMAERGPPGALLSGFLVGATDDLPAADAEALRLSGLSHYVAVSGSNVAGFLLLWYLALGPFGVGARRRGIAGLVAIAVFVVATRWEPSVIRAGLMAGLVLVGRVVGIPISPWSALGWSVTLALLVSPELAGDLGFQLSVLATGGILAGGELLPERAPSWLRGTLGPTLAAQLAVTPLLLLAFGTVPAVSPLANLAAAPLVVTATITGGVGAVSGFKPLVAVATVLAGGVLDLAHFAAGFPQVGWRGALALGAVALLARRPSLRPALAASVGAWTVWWLLAPGGVGRPALVFLDVGQGDAALVMAADGRNVLIDAGPDPPALAAALRRYRVDRIDLLVLTHPHDDHVAGLEGLVDRIAVGRLWVWGTTHSGPAWERIRREVATAGLIWEVPEVGRVEHFAGFDLEVLGPERRYEGANDQSIVLLIRSPTTRVLMSGDVEHVAQQDIGPVAADVLKVPHHGAATSDPDWLVMSGAHLAVISVGDNSYGHPHPEVLAILARMGAVVARTDTAGDIEVGLGLVILLVRRALRTINLPEEREDLLDVVGFHRVGCHDHPQLV